MGRYATFWLLALLAFLSGMALPPSIFGPLVRWADAAPERPRGVANSIVIGNAGRTAIRDYPFQFGRPFVKGAIPHAPQVLLDRKPIPTQADVKNRYPDGSVEFAVIAVVIPDLRVGATRVLSFQDTTANSNAPLTAAQMLAPRFDFDAAMSLSFPARIAGPAQTATLAQWQAVTNGGFTLTVGGAAYAVGALNFSGITGIPGILPVLQAGLKAARAPVVAMAPLQPAGVRAFTVQTIATGPAASLGYAAAPASGTDISAMLGWTSATKLNANLAGSTGTASARAMLAGGRCTPWTSGPIAQTMVCADDSAARAYDLGDGDGFHPFRPRFYATFWPATNQVFVRAVGENGLTTELEDLAYKLTISGGNRAPAIEYSADLTGDQSLPLAKAGATIPELDWSLSRWSRTFWLGGAPQAQVNIDNNLAYLESTRFIPNYDTAVNPTPGFAAYYTAYLNSAHNLYDGQSDHGIWQEAGETTGARPEIGPFPTWDVMWLYGGDWRMRQVALGLSDLDGAVPIQLRESAAGRRLSRADPAGSSTGLGHTVSITDRKTLVTVTEGDALAYAPPPDSPTTVGPLDIFQPWSTGLEASHQPDTFFIPYVLTGDRWYLSEMNAVAGFSAAFYLERGPSGDYGTIGGQLRGAAWAIAHRAETAFIEPDGMPEKAYFTYLVNDALARWEGGFGIVGTVFDGSPSKVWGHAQGNIYSANGGPQNAKVPPLGNWESLGNPASNPPDGTITENVNNGIYVSGTVGSFTSPWMQWYLLYALGRVKELGFADGPLLTWSAAYLTGMIDNSGVPELINVYQMPVERAGGGFLATWPAVLASLTPTYRSTKLPANFANDLGADGYLAYAVAAGAMAADEPSGAEAWSWLKRNVAARIAFASAPKWNLVPRTDNNVLPAQPTATPPG